MLHHKAIVCGNVQQRATFYKNHAHPQQNQPTVRTQATQGQVPTRKLRTSRQGRQQPNIRARTQQVFRASHVQVMDKGCGNQTVGPPHGLQTQPAASFTGRGLFGILNGLLSFRRYSILSLFTKANSVDCRFTSHKTQDMASIRVGPMRCGFVHRATTRLNVKGLCTIGTGIFLCLGDYPGRFSIVFSSTPCSLRDDRRIMELILRGSLLHPRNILVFRRSGGVSFSTCPRF